MDYTTRIRKALDTLGVGEAVHRLTLLEFVNAVEVAAKDDADLQMALGKFSDSVCDGIP
jgi:hypothetical protein